MNYASMLGHAFDLAPVSGVRHRNALCTSVQSGSLVTIAQLLGLSICPSSLLREHLILKLEKNCLCKNNYMSFFFKEVGVEPY